MTLEFPILKNVYYADTKVLRYFFWLQPMQIIFPLANGLKPSTIKDLSLTPCTLHVVIVRMCFSFFSLYIMFVESWKQKMSWSTPEYTYKVIHTYRCKHKRVSTQSLVCGQLGRGIPSQGGDHLFIPTRLCSTPFQDMFYKGFFNLHWKLFSASTTRVEFEWKQ